MENKALGSSGLTAALERINNLLQERATKTELENYTTLTKINQILGDYVKTTDYTTGMNNKVDKVSGKGLSTNDFTTAEKNKLATLENYDDSALVEQVSQLEQNINTVIGEGATEAIENFKEILDFLAGITDTQTLEGLLANLRSEIQGYLANKVDKVIGKGLSTNDFTSDLKSKLESIEEGAQVNKIETIRINGTIQQISEKVVDIEISENNKIIYSTIYIDQTITDPATMISGDINGEAIQAIRANSHRYICKYTAENTMTICQLLDTNSNYYHDGTEADLTGAEGDVFMLLPYFYTKATELTTDRWRIDFAFGGQPDGERWKQWGGNDLIGVYEAYLNDYKLYSISGKEPSANITQANLKGYVRNRGLGFTLVKHKHQNIMAFLFYALYGHTNANEKCGLGTSSWPKTVGETNSLGMTDTTASNGNLMSVNFWGLENWWNDICEFEDNVLINQTSTNCIWEITEDNGSTREVQGRNYKDVWYYPTKIIIGDYLDTIASPTSSNGGESTGFCDAQIIVSTKSLVVMRSGWTNGSDGGLIHVNANHTSNQVNGAGGSRLAFTGRIIKEMNVSTFKSLNAIS